MAEHFHGTEGVEGSIPSLGSNVAAFGCAVWWLVATTIKAHREHLDTTSMSAGVECHVRTCPHGGIGTASGCSSAW